jgi:hypothetical protein
MSSREWEIVTAYALDTLRQNRSCQISLSAFTFEENQNRYIVKESSLPYFKIFPWFSARGLRFRESLKRDSSQGATIDQVIEAVNYFLLRAGSDYSEEELAFLSSFYLDMPIPIASKCLSTIVTVYEAFVRFGETLSPFTSVLAQPQGSSPIRAAQDLERAALGHFPHLVRPLAPFHIGSPISLLVLSPQSDSEAHNPDQFVRVVMVRPSSILSA